MNNEPEYPVISHDPLINQAQDILSGKSIMISSRNHVRALMDFHDDAITYFHYLRMILAQPDVLNKNRGEIINELERVIAAAENKAEVV